MTKLKSVRSKATVKNDAAIIAKQPVISVQNVHFAYHHHEEILKNITFDVFEGDFLGLIGPNGGGKTTLLKLMVGILPLQKGKIKLFDVDIQKFKQRDLIGYVSQKAAHFDEHFPVTVEEIVGMSLSARLGFFNKFSREDKQDVETSLQDVGMIAYRNKPLHNLSGGQQQLVFIARALASHPQLLVLDEPTVGVDIKAQEEFYLLLKWLQKEKNLTIILVSHDIDVVASQANSFACLNQELVYHGVPKDFIRQDYLRKLYGKDLKLILHGH